MVKLITLSFYCIRKLAWVWVFMVLGLGLLSSSGLCMEQDKTGELWTPYVEWSFENPTYSGNPFDLIASAKFTHMTSGEVHTTELFYNGDNTWKLRFAGTRTGEWTFTTTSADPDLNDRSGIVTINPNPGGYGFVTNVGNKWARQLTEDGEVEPFVPNFVMIGEDPRAFTTSFIDQQIDTFFDGHGFNGFSTFLAAKWVDIDSSSTRWDSTTRREPDPRTFEALELLITKTHASGGVVHIWYVGDCSRSQCAQAGFGSNGARSEEEKRLLRYIGARLGPLPGWIMGYGYDNPEHVDTTSLRLWGNYLRDYMGWSHYLGARNQSKTSYTFWPEADFFSWGNLDWTYAETCNALDQEINKPHSLDERFWNGRWNMEQQRRGLWAFAMAGGASAIWAWDAPGGVSTSYPNPEQLHTYSKFWKDRFLKDMVRANNLTEGWCLWVPAITNYIFYEENTSSIQMDLSDMADAQQAVAVDTKLAYAEIDMGTFNPTNQTWTAPYSSDWAIAVGDFSEPPSDTSPSTAPQSLDGIPIGESQIDLTWQAASDPESGINKYIIYRDGTKVGESTTTSFSDTGLTESSTYTYEVSAVNGASLESEKSAPISATTMADTIAPSIISGTTSSDPNKSTVVFSEPVEEASAEDISNYGIDNDVTISGASLASDLKTVVLTTSPHTDGVTYTLNVNSIKDRASTPNLIAANTQVTYAFAGQLVISNLTVYSGKAYEVIENGLQSGSLVYIDRSYTFKDVPASLLGATYIKTANDDKGSTGSSFITFDVNQDVTVYVAHDNRITTKPSWMASFTDTGDDLVTTDTTLSIFAKDFSAGTVTLGGNEGGGNSMYSVIIVAQNTPKLAAPTGLRKE